MNISPASAFAAWAVFTAWLIGFVILEHFDADGPDLIDYIQWGSIVLPLLFYRMFRRWFAAWLARQSEPRQPPQ